MKKIFLIPIAIILAGGIWFVSREMQLQRHDDVPSGVVACTDEAKLCPDGSYVGRTGPNCEFALCPTGPSVPMPTSKKSGVAGKVTLSPTCPVERMPPDPACAPKPYSTSIGVFVSGPHQDVLKIIQSDSSGFFSAELDPGSYVLSARGGDVLPRCPQVSVIVKSGRYTQTEIACDTGIR